MLQRRTNSTFGDSDASDRPLLLYGNSPDAFQIKNGAGSALFRVDANSQNIIINGDLTVSGTTSTIASNNYVVSDILINIADGNGAVGDSLDTGIYTEYKSDGVAKYAGLIRKAGGGWYLLKNVTGNPDYSPWNASNDDLTVATLNIGYSLNLNNCDINNIKNIIRDTSYNTYGYGPISFTKQGSYNEGTISTDIGTTFNLTTNQPGVLSNQYTCKINAPTGNVDASLKRVSLYVGKPTGSITSYAIETESDADIKCGGTVYCDSVTSNTINTTGGISVGTLSCSSLTSSGSVSCGTNSMTCGAVSCSSLTSSGSVSCGTNSITCGAVSCSSLTSSGSVSCGTNSITCGAVSCSSITSSGTATLARVTMTGDLDCAGQRLYSVGKLGIFTGSVPENGVNRAVMSIRGFQNSSTQPSIEMTNNASENPCMMLTSQSFDHQGLLFNCYSDANNQYKRSEAAYKPMAIRNIGGQIIISAEATGTKNSIFSWLDLMTIDLSYVRLSVPMQINNITTATGTDINFNAKNIINSGNIAANSLSVSSGSININNSQFFMNDTSATPSIIRLIQSGGVNYIQTSAVLSGGSQADLAFTGMYASPEWMRLRASTSDITATTIIPNSATCNLGSSASPWQSIYLKSNGGTAAALDYYEEYKNTITFTGPYSVNSTMRIVRVGRIVTITLDGFQDTSASSTHFTATGVIPTRFYYGGVHEQFPCRTMSDSVFYIGFVDVSHADGTIEIYRGADANDRFTTGKTAAFYNFSFSYVLRSL